MLVRKCSQGPIPLEIGYQLNAPKNLSPIDEVAFKQQTPFSQRMKVLLTTAPRGSQFIVEQLVQLLENIRGLVALKTEMAASRSAAPFPV